jgi:Chaperone of endosialidase/Secretion system C-terminal sorting domain
MKRFLFTVYATVSLGCFFVKAQVTRNTGGAPTNATPLTNPLNISQFEVSGRLITQNAFVGLTAIPTAQQTGNFGTTARWNSMGSLPSSTQFLNGFRTQTDGRGFAWGHLIPTGGNVSNSFIEIIGNNTGAASVTATVDDPQNLGSSSGNLDFKYAESPNGANSARRTAFTIQPVVNAATGPQFDAFTYARANCLIGQLQAGKYGGLGSADKWIGSGTVAGSTNTYIGTRMQANRGNMINGLDNNGAFIQFGDINVAPTPFDPLLYNFLRFKGDQANGSFTDIMKMNVAGNIITGVDPATTLNPLNAIDPSFNTNLFVSGKGSSNNGVIGVGLYARPSVGSAREFAVWAQAYGGQPGKRAFGIYAAVDNPQAFDYAGIFKGDVSINGTLIVNGVTIASDKRLKKDIKEEDNAIAKIMQLKPVSYLYDKSVSKHLNLEYEKTSHGFLADDILNVFPEMVKEFEEPAMGNTKETASVYKSVNYIQLISVLTKGIQEQQVQINELKTQLNTTNTLVINDKLNLPADIENKAFSLSQNTPNPFSERTTISYSIPTTVQKATLAVFDLTGKMLLQYNLTQGKNQLTINGSTLPAGMYLYSLLADGQEVLSKKMILTK